MYIVSSSHRVSTVRSSHLEVFYKKKIFLKVSQNSQGNTCARTYFFIKKETLEQVFSCEFYEILKYTYFTEHLRVTASRQFHNLQFEIPTVIGGSYIALP